MSSPLVHSHISINNFKDSVDKIIKQVSFLTADLNNDVISSMKETTLTRNPLVISKRSVRLANDL